MIWTVSKKPYSIRRFDFKLKSYINGLSPMTRHMRCRRHISKVIIPRPLSGCRCPLLLLQNRQVFASDRIACIDVGPAHGFEVGLEVLVMFRHPDARLRQLSHVRRQLLTACDSFTSTANKDQESFDLLAYSEMRYEVSCH
jgi:hypothetical protein